MFCGNVWESNEQLLVRKKVTANKGIERLLEMVQILASCVVFFTSSSLGSTCPLLDLNDRLTVPCWKIKATVSSGYQFFFTEVAGAAETWWTEKRWKNGDSAADGPSAEIEIFSAGIIVDKDKRSRGYWRIDRTDLLLQVICVPISTCACGRVFGSHWLWRRTRGSAQRIVWRRSDILVNSRSRIRYQISFNLPMMSGYTSFRHGLHCSNHFFPPQYEHHEELEYVVCDDAILVV